MSPTTPRAASFLVRGIRVRLLTATAIATSGEEVRLSGSFEEPNGITASLMRTRLCYWQKFPGPPERAECLNRNIYAITDGMDDSGPPLVGLTGGIASGKSTVADFFRCLGVAVFDADAIARNLLAPATPAFDQVVGAFGAEIVHDDGTLNRAVLAERVFSDIVQRKTLERILHPLIEQRVAVLRAQNRSAGQAYQLYEAALLVETSRYQTLDGLIVVSVSSEVQAQRLHLRLASLHPTMTAEELRRSVVQRLDAQAPLLAKTAVADFVIDNTGNLDQTQRQVELIHCRLAHRWERRLHQAAKS